MGGNQMKENPTGNEHDGVMVKVSYPNSLAKEAFKFGWDRIISDLWEKAYTELGEGRKPDDILLNGEGESLMEHLNLTLRQLHNQHLCPGFKFTIKSGTGGAVSENASSNEGNQQNDKEDEGVTVKVSYPNSFVKEAFKFDWSGTISELWDKAYEELNEGCKPNDTLLNQDGESLMDYLNLTLRELHETHLCPGFFFVIKSDSGGAHVDYEIPVPNEPSKAAAAFEEHLQQYLAFGGYSSIEETQMWKEEDLTLFVPLRATGNRHDDKYLLRLHFGYYPKFPPSARFLNPETKNYDKATDLYWLPRIEGTNEFAIHPDYSQQGQLICNSMTLEFYIVRHSYSNRDHLWKSGMTFESTLVPIMAALKSRYYMGRQGVL
jgi:hypothetical protein